MASRAKKKELTWEEISRAVAEWPADEVRKLAAQISDAAAVKSAPGSLDPYAHKRQGTSRDSAVQRLAALKIYDLYEVKGLSFREIAELIGVSYERVRQLWLRFYPNVKKGTDDAKSPEAPA